MFKRPVFDATTVAALSGVGSLSALSSTVFSAMSIPLAEKMSRNHSGVTKQDMDMLRTYLYVTVSTLGVVLILSFVLMAPMAAISTLSTALILASLALSIWALVVVEEASKKGHALGRKSAESVRNLLIAVAVMSGLVTLGHAQQTMAFAYAAKIEHKSPRKARTSARRSSRRSGRRSSRRSGRRSSRRSARRSGV